MFDGLSGVVCIVDGVIIHRRDKKEHDERMQAFLARCHTVGMKLNRDKMDTGVEYVTFMGHRISTNGLQADPQKVYAIIQMKEPNNLAEIRQFIGMITYLSKFFWKSGKYIPLADALSRAPTDNPTEDEIIHYVTAHHII